MFCGSRGETLYRPARDRRDEQHFIAFLKRVCLSAEESDIFLVNVDVQESANLSAVVSKVRLQLRKLLIEHGEEFGQI